MFFFQFFFAISLLIVGKAS